MLEARIVDRRGRTVQVVTADDLDKAAYYELAAQGHLRCTCCPAPVSHVSDALANGGFPRIAHFRSDNISDHDLFCDNRIDPKSNDKAILFKRALDKGLPILIHVDMAPEILGFRRLTHVFNPLVNNPDTGLFTKQHWISRNPDYASFPAYDVTDILYYLDMAKEHGGQNGMKQLWFNTRNAVQSCQRFVIGDRANKFAQLLEDMIVQAHHARIARSEDVSDTPRLFLFRASDAQVQKSAQVSHLLYGQMLETTLRSRTDQNKEASHLVKLGLRLKNAAVSLSNQSVLQAGRSLWAIGVPEIGRRRIHDISAKVDGLAHTRVGPAFAYFSIHDRTQFVPFDTPLRKVPPQARQRQKTASPRKAFAA